MKKPMLKLLSNDKKISKEAAEFVGFSTLLPSGLWSTLEIFGLL
jgi:hypothetical protein